MAVQTIFLAPNQWTDLYASTGIAVGTSLILNAYNQNIDVVDTAAPPAIDFKGFPIGVTRQTSSTILTANSPGAWARPTNSTEGAFLTVQENTNSSGNGNNNDFSQSFPLLTTNGLFDGDSNMAVNGSITPVDFFSSTSGLAPLTSTVYIKKIAIIINSSATSSLNEYGNISSLTNGTEFFFETNGNRNNLFGPTIIQRTADFYTARLRNTTYNYNTNENIILWESDFFTDNNNLGIPLNPATNDLVGVTVNDDLSSLIFHQSYVVLSFLINN